MSNAFRPIFRKRVVRISPALHRVKPRVNVVPRRRAHRSCLETLSKPHAFFRKLINIWSQSLPAVTTDVTMCAIVGDDEKEIWQIGVFDGRLRSRDVRRQRENGKSNKAGVAKKVASARILSSVPANVRTETVFWIESLVFSERVRQLVGPLYLIAESAKWKHNGGRSCSTRPEGRECGCFFADGTLPIGNQWTLRAVLTMARISGENVWRMFAAER